MKFLNFFPRPREGVEEETTPPLQVHRDLR